MLFGDLRFLLFPFHAERGIGQHVIERVFLVLRVVAIGIFREGIAENDVVRFLPFDEHVGSAGGPGVIIPVLTVHDGRRVAVEFADVFLGFGEHPAGSAGWIVDRFDDVTFVEIFFGSEQEIDHQPDDFAGGKVFPGFFIGLFGPDPDQFFENVAHLDIVDCFRREIDLRGAEGIDDLIEQPLLRHPRDFLIELEPVHDVPDVLREAVDVTVEILRHLEIGIRPVDGARESQLREIVEGSTGDRSQFVLDHRFRFAFQFAMFGQNLVVSLLEQAVEATQDRDPRADRRFPCVLVDLT